MPIITSQNNTAYGKFSIENLQITNLNAFTQLDYNSSPVPYNLSFNDKFVTGDIVQNNLQISLTIKDPSTNKLITNGTVDSDVFSGIKVDLYTLDRNYITTYIQNTNKTVIDVSSSDLSNLILNYTGASGVNNLRTFYLDIKTFDKTGTQDSYYLLLNYPQVSITGFEINTSNPVLISPLLNNYNYVKNIDIYGVPKKYILPTENGFFDSNSGLFKTTFDYENNRQKQTFNLKKVSFVDPSLEVTLPYNIVAIPNDYFYTGAYYLTSGIKTSFYSTDFIPQRLDNITGYISCVQNIFDKNLDLNAIVKWDAVQTKNALTFETYVYEDGSENASLVFNSSNPSVEAVSDIVFGTGSGVIRNNFKSNYYSGDTPIFKKYGSSGIQWYDHTLYIDNYNSLPLGLYSPTRELNYVTEVRIPSGVSPYPELYFVYKYERSSNTFQLLPSGGRYSGSIYTGTYSGARYTGSAGGGTGPSGPSGPASGPSVMNYETGILLAKRITGNADFVLSEFEPKVKFPINPQKNYEIKVRASYQDGSYSDFSDILRFTSGNIQSVVTGLISNNYVIEGSGTSGYLAKYIDRDTISTGTLYYDSSNNLKFSSLPISTSSATNYLVVESNTIKLQAGSVGGSGNGTTLIDTITQASHGFTIGDIVRYDGSLWKKANAESEANAEAIGIIQSSTTNTFDIVYDGKVTGLSSLTPSSVYFLSDLVSGAYTLTEPTANNHVSKPVLFSLSATDALFLTYRGYVITDAIEVNNFKFLTIKNPTAAENVTFFYTPSAITISRLDDVVVGTNPSLTWNLNYAQYRNSSSPTGLFSSDRVTTNISGSSTTTFANPNIPPSSWLWLKSSATGGILTEFSATIKI